MKKLLLVIGLFMFCITGMQAQQNPCFGLKIVGGISNITNGDNSFSFKPSFGIGGTCRYTFSPNFAIQPEVLVSFKGAKDSYSHSLLNKDYDITFNATYLEIPILFKGIFGSNSIYAGPYFAFALNSEITIDIPVLGEQGVDDIAKSSEIGICAGYERYFTRNFSAEARFSYGFTEIFDITDNEVKDYVGTDFKNYSIIIGLNYY